MPWWTWLSLGIFLAATVATAVFSAFAFGRLRRLTVVAERIQTRLDEVRHAAEELERRMARTQERMEELERHRARLETSVERLRVLTSALSDAGGGVMGLRRLYLRK
jgi:septal ring factor EnvC (AmiA/AmiB activator)